MPSSYPTAIDALAINKANATATTADHPAHHNDMADAINKIEAELGINPRGGYATVAAKVVGAFYDVKDYGAVGNDTTDDTTAIQNAVAAASAAGGGVVFLPKGTFKISGTIDLGLTVSMVGISRGASILHYTGSSHAVSIGNAAAAGAPGTALNRVSDFTIQGVNAATVGSIGIRVIKCLFPVLERMYCTQIETGYKIDGSDLWCASGSLLHLRTQNVKFGMLFTANAGKQVNDMTVLGGYFYGGGSENGAYGIKVEALSDSNKFFGVACEGFAGVSAKGFWITAGATGGTHLFGTRTETCTTEVLLDTTATQVIIVGHTGGTVTDNGYANLIVERNIIRHATRFVSYAAAITPDVFDGEVKEVGSLTGNITVNNPTNSAMGARLTFYFQQDATGGRTITFGAKYRANWTPDTGANKRNTITFSYSFYLDLWLQISSVVGLAA